MANTKLIAVVVILVVVAAGTGLYFLNNSNDSSNYRSDDDTGRLMIYGNANNDDYLDEDDVATLEKVISGELEATTYSDANLDGKVDQSDIDMVEKMIDRESMEIYYDYYYGGNLLQGQVSYPITSACIVGTSVLLAMKSIGAEDDIVCISGGTIDSTLYSDIVDLPTVSDSLFKANVEEVSKYTVSAIITSDSSSFLTNYSDFETAGIDVVRISASDGIESISGVITLGYLLQCEDRANAYAQFCDEVIDYVQSKIGSDVLSDDDRVTALSVTMTNYVGGTSSDYYAATELAGAINLADWSETTKRFNIGDEWLLESKYQADYIVHVRSIGYGTYTSEQLVTIWDTYSQYFTAMDAYEDGNYLILNGNMPVPVRIAYMASIFYPDIFGSDYGAQVHQTFIDNFVDNLNESGYDVTTDGIFVLTSDMIAATSN